MTNLEKLKLYDHGIEHLALSRDAMRAVNSSPLTMATFDSLLQALRAGRGYLVGMLTAEEGVAYYQGLIENQKKAAEELMRLTS